MNRFAVAKPMPVEPPVMTATFPANLSAMLFFCSAIRVRIPRETTIKVNSAGPGYTATDLNGHRGTRTVAEGAIEIVRLALLPDDGPTRSFFAKNGSAPW